jgi:hypothetical protein
MWFAPSVFSVLAVREPSASPTLSKDRPALALVPQLLYSGPVLNRQSRNTLAHLCGRRQRRKLVEVSGSRVKDVEFNYAPQRICLIECLEPRLHSYRAAQHPLKIFP